jgi:hypothetical protein
VPHRASQRHSPGPLRVSGSRESKAFGVRRAPAHPHIRGGCQRGHRARRRHQCALLHAAASPPSVDEQPSRVRLRPRRTGTVAVDNAARAAAASSRPRRQAAAARCARAAHRGGEHLRVNAPARALPPQKRRRCKSDASQKCCRRKVIFGGLARERSWTASWAQLGASAGMLQAPPAGLPRRQPLSAGAILEERDAP